MKPDTDGPLREVILEATNVNDNFNKLYLICNPILM